MKKTVLVLGGNRFFGRHLTKSLLESGYEVTLLNRGQADDVFGNQVQRLKADRKRASELSAVIGKKSWDFVFDQICYTATEAKAICDLLSGQTKKVIFTSSQSIYDYGISLSEEIFDPFNYRFTKEVTADEDYSEAKRQSEAVFAKYTELNPVMVRMPFVVGNDDYTGRFAWHIERCEKGLPIYFSNENAKLGFIRSDFAGRALHQIMEADLKGPVNCTCPGDIRLSDFMTLIEKETGKSYIRASVSKEGENSPYGAKNDWTMNLKKLETSGISLPNLDSWISDLIREEYRKLHL